MWLKNIISKWSDVSVFSDDNVTSRTAIAPSAACAL